MKGFRGTSSEGPLFDVYSDTEVDDSHKIMHQDEGILRQIDEAFLKNRKICNIQAGNKTNLILSLLFYNPDLFKPENLHLIFDTEFQRDKEDWDNGKIYNAFNTNNSIKDALNACGHTLYSSTFMEKISDLYFYENIPEEKILFVNKILLPALVKSGILRTTKGKDAASEEYRQILPELKSLAITIFNKKYYNAAGKKALSATSKSRGDELSFIIEKVPGMIESFAYPDAIDEITNNLNDLSENQKNIWRDALIEGAE